MTGLNKRAISFSSIYTTGYFGRAREAGHDARTTRTHVVKNDGTCLCGYKPHKTMKLQFNATGIMLSYVECTECEKKGFKLLYDELVVKQPKAVKSIVISYSSLEDYSAAYKSYSEQGFDVAVVVGLKLSLIVKGFTTLRLEK